MPTFKNHTIFEIARGVKGFLRLDVGLTRGMAPGFEQEARQDRNGTKKQKVIGRERRLRAVRRDIASRYLTGQGLEVGGLNQPLEVPDGVTVRYVDRMTVEQLRKEYPELCERKFVEVDVVDDGETLPSIMDSTVDFVIANNFIEHCQNPIAMLENHLRVLRPGGILYIAVPDKRFTFDHDRPATPLEHLIRDYKEGPTVSVNSHYEEWARVVLKLPEDEAYQHAKHLAKTSYSIHFHVWTQVEFLELLLYCWRSLHFPFEIELFQNNDLEFICVLRKRI